MTGEWTFDSATAPLKASVGSDAIAYKNVAEAESGLGGLSVVTDSSILASAKGGAIAIPKTKFLAVPHGVTDGTKWCFKMRFYVPSVSCWHALYSLNMANDGDAWLGINKDTGAFGNTGTGGIEYKATTLGTGIFGRWNTLVLTVDSTSAVTLYVNGEKLGTSSKYSNYDLTGKNYIYIGADNDGEQNLFYIDSVEVYDETKPAEVFDASKFTDHAPTGPQAVRTLPSGYTQLESITSSGAQYIDTGLIPSTDTAVDLNFGNVSYVDSTALFGQEWNSNQYLFNMQQEYYKFHGGGTTLDKVIGSTDYRCQINTNGTLYLAHSSTVNDYQVSLTSSTTSHLFLFGRKGGGNFASFTFYGFKVWKNDILLRDFVPALRNSDSKPGLYDLAGNSFYVNAGTGADFSYVNGTPVVDNLACTDKGQKSANFTVDVAMGDRATMCDVYSLVTKVSDGSVVTNLVDTITEDEVGLPFAVSGLEPGEAYSVRVLVRDTVTLAGVVCHREAVSDPVPVMLADIDDWENYFTISLGDELQTVVGSETLDGFPLLVRLSTNSISGFKYSDFKVENGGDLVFLDASENFLEYEIDTWDTNGVSLVWVKIPSLTEDTEITCRYRGPEYPHTDAKTWSNYVGVWHMNEESGTAIDATGHGLDGTPKGGSAGKTSDMVGTDGLIGKSRVNQKSAGSNINGMLIPNYNSYITTASKFSVGGWYKATGANGYIRPLSRKTSYEESTGFEVEFTNGSVNEAKVCGSSKNQVVYKMPNMTMGWCNLLYVFDGTTVTVYTNGYKSASGTIAAVAARDAGLMFGNNLKAAEAGWYGVYDELRLCDGVISAARAATGCRQVLNESALVTSAIKTPDPELPRLKNCDAVAISNGNIVVSGSVLRHSGEVTVTLTAEGCKTIVVNLGEIAAGGDFEREFTDDDGLVKFVTYNVSIACANGEKKAGLQLADPVKFGKVALTDFNYRFDVTVTNGFTEAALTNFPLLVRLSTAIEGFDYGQFQREGEDLMAFDADGNPLPYELENFDTEGESRLWVQVPVVTNGVKLSVGYSSSETLETKAMWTEYASVLHLNTDAVPDSTGNATPTANAASVLVTGVLGQGRSMGTTTGKNGACVTVPVSTKLDECNGVFTASAWTKLNASPNWGYLMSRKVLDSTASWGLQFRGSGNDGGVGGLAFSTAGNSEGKSVIFSPLTCFKTGSWVKWNAIYNGTELSLYIDGALFATKTTSYGEAVNGTCALGVGGFADSTGHATLPAVIDEARVKVGAVSADWIAAEYKQEMNLLPLEYGAVGPSDPSVPVIETPVVSPNGDGAFTVVATISENMPKAGSVKFVYNGETTVLTTSDTSVPAHYVHTFTPAAANVTDQITVKAKSTIGSLRTRTVSFYNGELAIEKIRDASEKGLTNGIWRITRADTNLVLAVALQKLDTSTAVAGTDYYDFELEAAIPDGTNSVDVLLAPKMNLDRDEETWVDLAISNGAYRIDSTKGSARVTIKNYEVPSGGNIWCATAAGKASVGSNWTSGVAPDENTAVVFDGDVSTADCEWDIDAANTVKAWSQNSKYTGTVTIDNSYDDTFPELVIKEDAVVAGGKWTHKGNYYSAANNYKIASKYRISVKVGGDFYLSSAASIDVTKRGWGYVSGTYGNAVCHGGWSDARDWTQAPYGDYREPIDPGTGVRGQSDQSIGDVGGGAVKLVVSGLANLDGAVLADGSSGSGSGRNAATGGSVWIKARQISGAGKISTSAGSKAKLTSDQAAGIGSGGRMALYTEETLAKDLDLLYCNGTAYGAASSKMKLSGPGTIFIKDDSMENGMLFVRQPPDVCSYSNTGASTPVLGDWAFDKIVLSGAVQLRVLPGNSLTVPSLASITPRGNSSAKSAIVVPAGAAFNCGTGDQTLGGYVALATEEWTLDGNLALASGAKIGPPDSLYSSSSANYDPCFGIAVTGNLTIPSGATASATRSVAINSDGKTARYGAHGGQSLWTSLKGYGYENGYDSVLDPTMPGCSQSLGFFAGGALTLEVGGELKLDGTIASDGGNVRGDASTYDNSSAGSGGTINLRLGSLSGSGSISAGGGCGKYNYAGGAGGGRIAVYLNDEEAAFSDWWISHINAYGMSFGSSSGNDKAGSAGTVYLVDGTRTDATGVIYVRNDAALADAIDNQSTTCIPGTDATCDSAAALKDTSLVLEGAARVKLTDNLESAILKAINHTKVDLAGKSYTVRVAYVNGSKVELGTYEAGDEPFGDILEDSVGGGTLRITGYGLWVFIQ